MVKIHCWYTAARIHSTDSLVHCPAQLSCTAIETGPFQVLKMNKLCLNDPFQASLQTLYEENQKVDGLLDRAVYPLGKKTDFFWKVSSSALLGGKTAIPLCTF